MLETLIIGQPYPNTIPVYDGTIAEFLRPTYNRLFIGLPSMTNEEWVTLSEGRVSAKIYVDRDSSAMMLVFSFERGGFQLNFDCPYDASIVGDIQLPEVLNNSKRLAIEIVIVDTETLVLKSLRFITMSEELTSAFLGQVEKQLSREFNASEANHWIDKQRMLFSANELAALPFPKFRLA
ncbi:TPA: hypothetical protein KDY92_004241 [Vibrio alginolyticus]|nr:hypothetical protein [Vibrio alginolyticus]